MAQRNASSQQNTAPAHHGGPDRRWLVRALALGAVDALVIAGSYLMALLLRFDLSFAKVPPEYAAGYLRFVPVVLATSIAVMWAFRLYHSIWRFASVTELARLVGAWCCEQAVVVIVALATAAEMPVSFYVGGSLFALGLTAADRFFYRFMRGVRNIWDQRRPAAGDRQVMIVGAGSSGLALVKEILASEQLHMHVACAIDDNPSKRGRYLENVPIVGDRSDIARQCEKFGIDLIVVAMPAATGEQLKGVLDACQRSAAGRGGEVLVVPGIHRLVDAKVTVAALRRPRIEDLLGRDPVTVDQGEVNASLAGKVVLVTGGGGSIGSELCRQVAQAGPKRLIIFDIYENNAYAIQQELRRAHPGLDLVTLIGSVRDEARVRDVFAAYRPQVVFHAAAHKHVPLMEDSPREAVKNNVEGTYKVARAAVDYGTGRFVLISTDKAVNPTNVMGATKRLCEMVVQMMDRRSSALAAAGGTRTEFSAVRFGNVLGSNGSVVPLFERQIAEGGPVTVTDPRVVRYFMTIAEAVSLILQACCYARGGEIFVLDMGEPVRIDDMARKLIRLTGHEPDGDIKVVYTGLRPGEKLYEERLMGEEGLRRTANSLISVAEPIDMDDEAFMGHLAELERVCADERADVRAAVAAAVPTYHPERGGAEGNRGTADARAARDEAGKRDAGEKAPREDRAAYEDRAVRAPAR